MTGKPFVAVYCPDCKGQTYFHPAEDEEWLESPPSSFECRNKDQVPVTWDDQTDGCGLKLPTIELEGWEDEKHRPREKFSKSTRWGAE